MSSKPDHAIHQNDPKRCSPNQPYNTIATITDDDEDFYVQTALLWVRSLDSLHGPTSTRPSQSEADSSKHPPESLRKIVDCRSYEEDNTIPLREDESDLGLLHLHRDRLAAAAKSFGWDDVGCLKHDEEALGILKREIENHISDLSPLPAATPESRKVKILINKLGNVSIESIIINLDTPLNCKNFPSRSWIPSSLDDNLFKPDSPPCKVWLDHQPTHPSTLTTHKTTHRDVYNSARERANLGPSIPPTTQEVLLYTPFGEIIEASFCTVYFKRGGRWVTPAATCGPNLGVTRRLAIESGLCEEGIIELRGLRVNEEVWLSNAVRGFFRGVLAVDAERVSRSIERQATMLRNGLEHSEAME